MYLLICLLEVFFCLIVNNIFSDLPKKESNSLVIRLQSFSINTNK